MKSELNLDDLKSKIKVGLKIWLEFEGNNILGSGWANLLQKIHENIDEDTNQSGSLTNAARECGYSYKYAWNILKRIEERTGVPPVITGKGGPGGGGWIKLSEWGLFLLNYYIKSEKLIAKIEEILINDSSSKE